MVTVMSFRSELSCPILSEIIGYIFSPEFLYTTVKYKTLTTGRYNALCVLVRFNVTAAD